MSPRIWMRQEAFRFPGHVRPTSRSRPGTFFRMGPSNVGKQRKPRMHGTLQILDNIPHPQHERPTRSEAEEAVRTLIRWAGEAPSREGLADTPARVVRAYEEWFGGYEHDPAEMLKR